MKAKCTIRKAIQSDAYNIARLIDISSDGVAKIEWVEEAKKNNCTPMEIGEQTYQNDVGDYSWRNCIIVECDESIAGMLLSFGMGDTGPRDTNMRPARSDKNVLAPYMYLEEGNSWYICGIAFYPEYRGKGLGTELMEIAEQQALEKGFGKLSLIVFCENEGAVRLYERIGYKVVDSAPIVPHPLIRKSGDALLMVKEIK